MKKKRWGLLFIASMVVSLAIFLSVLVELELRRPSDDWSNEIDIAKDITDFKQKIVSSSMLENKDGFVTFWRDGDQLKFQIIHEDGKEESIESLTLPNPEFRRIKSQHLTGSLYNLFGIVGDNFTRYVVDIESSTIQSEAVLEFKTSEFKVSDNKIALFYDKVVTLIKYDEANKYTEIDTIDVLYYNNLEIVTPENSTYLLIDGDIEGILYQYTDDLLVTTKVVVPSQIKGHMGFLGTLKEDNGYLGIVYNYIDQKFGRTRYNVHVYDLETLELAHDHNYTVQISKAVPKITTINATQVNVLIRNSSLFGLNVAEVTFEDGTASDVTYLTRTKTLNNDFEYFELSNSRVIRWIGDNIETATISYASTDKSVVKKSVSLSRINFLLTSVTLIMILVSTPIFGLPTVITILLPTFVIIGIAEFFMNKTDKQVNISRVITLSVHTIVKFGVVLFNIVDKDNYAIVFSGLFSSKITVAIVLILSSLIAIYTANAFKKSHKIEGTIGYYGIFALVDLTLLGLTILSYTGVFWVFAKF